MSFRTSLALVSISVLLGACAMEDAGVAAANAVPSGTVQLRILLRSDSGTLTPISDNFVSSLVGTTVDVLSGPQLCPPPLSGQVSLKAAPVCSVSFVLKTARPGYADVEFAVAGATGNGGLLTDAPVLRHLELGNPVSDALSVGPYVFQATYMAPMPRPEKTLREPPTLQLVPGPLRLF